MTWPPNGGGGTNKIHMFERVPRKYSMHSGGDMKCFTITEYSMLPIIIIDNSLIGFNPMVKR